MKNKKQGILSMTAVLTMTLLFAGCSGGKKDVPEDPNGSSATSEVSGSGEMIAAESDTASVLYPSGNVNTDYILEQLQIYNAEIPSIDLDQEITVPVSIPAGEEADIAVYKYVPDTSGAYELELSVPENCGAKTYVSIIDQNANTLNEFPDTTAGMLIGQQYFLVFYTEAENPDKEVSFALTATLKFMYGMVDYQELEVGENQFTVETEAEKVAAFLPNESGYYRLDVHCLDSEHGIAVINAVLREGEDDIFGDTELYYMDAGSAYIIDYGVYESGTEEVDVCIDIEPISMIELGKKETVKTNQDMILIYTASKKEDLLVYSISDGDPTAVVYDEDFDIVAENSDAEGVFSDNDHDFAMYVPTEKGKEYIIVVDHVEGHMCEVHLENA